MATRLATCIVASMMAVATQSHAQTHSDKALNYIQGQWYNSEGRTIDFYVSRDIPKFTDSAGPSEQWVGSYRAGEGGADYVLEYPFGLKCYYNVNIGSGSDQKELVFALRRATPEKDERLCIRGALRRQADRK